MCSLLRNRVLLAPREVLGEGAEGRWYLLRKRACEKLHSPLWEGWDLNTLGPRPVWLWLPSELLAPQVGGPLCPSQSAQNLPPQLSLPSWGGSIAPSLSLLPAWSSRDNAHSKDSRVPPPPAPDSYISGRPRGCSEAASQRCQAKCPETPPPLQLQL